MALRDLISIEECAEVVRKSCNLGSENEATTMAPLFRVISYWLEKVPGQPGFMGEYVNMTVTIEMEDGTNKQLKYFIKCVPFSDPQQRQLVEEHGFFTKEAAIYRELFTKLNQDPSRVIKWRPSCWLVRGDLMVMEDLIDSGYRSMPLSRPFGTTHVLLVLESLAQMHACSLDLEFNQMNREKLEAKFGKMLFETAFKRDNMWFDAGLRGLLKAAQEFSKYSKNASNKKLIESDMMTKMDWIFKLSEPSERYQSVLIHKDLWYNNIMFRFGKNKEGTEDLSKPVGCVLLDFQLTRYQPPAIDFLCAIYLLTRNPERRDLFDFYVKYYHDQLSDKLRKLNLDVETVLPRQQFEESVQHYKLFGLIWSGVLHAFTNLPDGFIGDLHVKDPEAYHEFCLVSRDSLMMKFLREDRYYRETLMDSVDETLEYLFGFQ